MTDRVATPPAFSRKNWLSRRPDFWFFCPASATNSSWDASCSTLSTLPGIAGIDILDHFCSCDRDLYPMTFIYEPDPYSLEIYRVCNCELFTSRFSNIIVRQIYRQTDRQTRPKLYTTPLRGWSEIFWGGGTREPISAPLPRIFGASFVTPSPGAGVVPVVLLLGRHLMARNSVSQYYNISHSHI